MWRRKRGNHKRTQSKVSLHVKLLFFLSSEKINNTNQPSRKRIYEFKLVRRVVQLLEDTPVLHTVQVEILKALKRLETSDGENRYAIRSSAVGEDSEDTSAAGQNSTFLGVKDADDVLQFVARCWASLYSYQSAEYR